MMPKKLPKGVIVDRDRHRNVRYYFRATGREKVRLREAPGTKAFEQEVSCARLGLEYQKNAPATMARTSAKAGSLQWLIEQYKARGAGALSLKVRSARQRILEDVCDSKKGSHRRGDLPFSQMALRHVTEIRDELRDLPAARNNVVRAISAVFSWAIENGLADRNPAQRIRNLRSGDGFHAWTADEVRQFEKHHQLGTKARLAFSLATYTGLRISDITVVGRQHVKDAWLSIRPAKTGHTSKVLVEIPVLPELQKAIDAGPCGDLSFLASERGTPFSKVRLGTLMRKWCDDAGLPHCSMHGLRKAGATIAAENGATDDELMAIFGWTTKQQTTLYTKNASRKRLAGQAMHKLISEQKDDKNVPLALDDPKSGTK